MFMATFYKNVENSWTTKQKLLGPCILWWFFKYILWKLVQHTFYENSTFSPVDGAEVILPALGKIILAPSPESATKNTDSAIYKRNCERYQQTWSTEFHLLNLSLIPSNFFYIFENRHHQKPISKIFMHCNQMTRWKEKSRDTAKGPKGLSCFKKQTAKHFPMLHFF